MSFDAHDLDLNELIICRNLLNDEVIRHMAQPADTPEEFRREAASCAARLIQLAETQGLGGNLLRTYLLYLLVHEKNLAAQAVEEFAKEGQIGGSLLKAFIHDLEILLPLLELPASTFLALPLLDEYTPTRAVASEASAALQELTKAFEYEIIKRKYINNNYRLTMTARDLGISKQSLRYKLIKYGFLDINSNKEEE